MYVYKKYQKIYFYIGFSVPDVYQAAERFEKLDVKFIKKPDDVKMKVQPSLKIQMVIGQKSYKQILQKKINNLSKV